MSDILVSCIFGCILCNFNEVKCYKTTSTHQSLQHFESLHWVLYPVGLYKICVPLCRTKKEEVKVLLQMTVLLFNH